LLEAGMRDKAMSRTGAERLMANRNGPAKRGPAL
jgi:hypothetical protein